MQFWKPPATSKHTRLAKEPALDKCKPDEEWKKELRPNTYQVNSKISVDIAGPYRRSRCANGGPLINTRNLVCYVLSLWPLMSLGAIKAQDNDRRCSGSDWHGGCV